MTDQRFSDVTLHTIEGLELEFQNALGEVLENIDDPNTQAEAARAITIKVNLKPFKERRDARLSFTVATSLAKPVHGEENVFIGRRRGALVMSHDNLRQDHLEFDGERPNTPEKEADA